MQFKNFYVSLLVHDAWVLNSNIQKILWWKLDCQFFLPFSKGCPINNCIFSEAHSWKNTVDSETQCKINFPIFFIPKKVWLTCGNCGLSRDNSIVKKLSLEKVFQSTFGEKTIQIYIRIFLLILYHKSSCTRSSTSLDNK